MSILGPTLFNISVYDLDNVTESPPSKFADDTRMGGEDTSEGAKLQRNHLTEKTMKARRAAKKELH